VGEKKEVAQRRNVPVQTTPRIRGCDRSQDIIDVCLGGYASAVQRTTNPGQRAKSKSVRGNGTEGRNVHVGILNGGMAAARSAYLEEP
jgi:hypothetical protein